MPFYRVLWKFWENTTAFPQDQEALEFFTKCGDFWSQANNVALTKMQGSWKTLENYLSPIICLGIFVGILPNLSHMWFYKHLCQNPIILSLIHLQTSPTLLGKYCLKVFFFFLTPNRTILHFPPWDLLLVPLQLDKISLSSLFSSKGLPALEWYPFAC